MHDLKRLCDKEFSDHLLITIQTWLDKSKSKLDPKEFRTLYINKNYSNSDFQGANNKKKQRQVSLALGNNNSQSFTNMGGNMKSVSSFVS